MPATAEKLRPLAERCADLPTASRPWSPDWEPVRIPMTIDEYFDAPLPHGRFEWFCGEAVEMPAVDLSHSLLHAWLTMVIGTYVDTKNLGILALAEYPIRLPDASAARQPDILFVREANRSRATQKFVVDAADLAIEIVSPGTVNHDRRTKFVEYQTAGVHEYLILDPRRRRADFFELVEGQYRPAVLDDDGDRYHFRTIEGLWIDVEWLWKRPPVLEVLRQLGLIA